METTAFGLADYKLFSIDGAINRRTSPIGSSFREYADPLRSSRVGLHRDFDEGHQLDLSQLSSRPIITNEHCDCVAQLDPGDQQRSALTGAFGALVQVENTSGVRGPHFRFRPGRTEWGGLERRLIPTRRLARNKEIWPTFG